MAATMAAPPSHAAPAAAANMHLPSIGSQSPFLHPAGQTGRRGSITDPEMHAQPSYPDTGSRPGSSHQEGAFERRPSVPDTFDEAFGYSYDRRGSGPASVQLGVKRKTSSDVDAEGEASGGSSQDLNAKRRSSVFSGDNRLANLSLDRRSSVGSTYSTSSSAAGWSPAPAAHYGWAGQPMAMPPYGFPAPGFPGSQPGFAQPLLAHPYPGDPRQPPGLNEQLANYGFPPPALQQAPSSVGPLRRGSAPVLRGDASGSDPRRVFGSPGKDDDGGEGRERAGSIDEGDSGGSANGKSTSTRESPYSRSPELRVSHKLAERKRRKEMTSLFDELRESVPIDRGARASKWETLVKAIDYIAHLKELNNTLTADNEGMRQHLGIPARPAQALPYILQAQQSAAAAAAAAGVPPHIPSHTAAGLPQLPPGSTGMQPGSAGSQPPNTADTTFPYPYVPHQLAPPPGWAGAQGQQPPTPGGQGQTTPRPGAAYMNAPLSANVATTPTSATGSA